MTTQEAYGLNFRTRTAIPAALAVGVAIFCGAAAADARPTLTAPARVRMGARVSVTVHGFAPNRRLQITIQAARYYLSNGGAIAVKTSVRVGANGSAVVRFRWPRGYYAVCVGASYAPVTPWRAGEHAYITVDDSVGPDPGEDVATSPRPVLVTSARGRAAILVSDATVPEAASDGDSWSRWQPAGAVVFASAARQSRAGPRRPQF